MLDCFEKKIYGKIRQTILVLLQVLELGRNGLAVNACANVMRVNYIFVKNL